ncbi:MAG: phage holin family protein, partial [Bacillota bacterium]
MGGWVRHVVRLVVSALVLMVVSWVAPGFSSLGFVSALIAAVVITVAGYI